MYIVYSRGGLLFNGLHGSVVLKCFLPYGSVLQYILEMEAIEKFEGDLFLLLSVSSSAPFGLCRPHSAKKLAGRVAL